MPVRFDDSLSILAAAVAEDLGVDALAAGVAVRDVTGRLCFYATTALTEEQGRKVSARLAERLGPYARTDRVLAGVGDIGAGHILGDSTVLPVKAGAHIVRLLDRRLVGGDWLRSPAPAAPPPRRFVFASLKGGVGRSTALSIAAVNFAANGHRVLAIDLDMEAPGLGPMLLDEGTLPEFGFVDALVENGLSGLDEDFLADFRGPSALAHRQGSIDVIPAFGKRSRTNPSDVLSKISRAYTEDIRPDGAVFSILDQVREIVDLVADPARYDAILIDARAGLHETTASAILGLGADVFLFGLDEPQTFQGYEFLLAHLARFANGTDTALPEWLERITMVQGRAPADPHERAGFAERCAAMFQRAGFISAAKSVESIPLPAEPFNAVPWEDSGGLADEESFLDERRRLAEPVAILDDPRFKNFDPIRQRDWFTEEVYRAAYGAFLERLSAPFVVAGEVAN
jgi:hypothetical protein